MPSRDLNLVDLESRRQWRAWLRRHHASTTEAWLVFHKGKAAAGRLTYEDAIQEALCFGWVDSLIRRIDEARYARKFTPRKADSRWSSSNRRRYADLARRGLLTKAGLSRPPTERDGDAPRPSLARLPKYIERALQAEPRAWETFRKLAPSHRRAYIGWVDSAKREATKMRRLEEAVRRLAAGEKLGLK